MPASPTSISRAGGGSRSPSRPLDEGDLDISAIMRALSDIRFDGWITAELDRWPDPKEGASRSLAFLQQAAEAA